MKPLWIHHDAVLGHDIPGHPERPDRVRALEARMAQDDYFGWERREAPVVEREQLLTVHPAEHVDLIEDICARGGGPIDMDTIAMEGTWEAITRAAGGAAALVDALVTGEARYGMSAMRPPGHHAEASQAMGFCFFNFVAVAARQATRVHGLERVLIFDWDVHHGNGTNFIFHADKDVLFSSIHQMPLYPGTGAASDIGSGGAEGYTVNLPVGPGTGDDAYRSLAEHVIVPLAREFEPQLILVSAGFDAHVDDPLGSCRVTEAGFAGMTRSVRRIADELGVGVGLVLEGGYSTFGIAESVAALAPELSADETPAAEDVPLHPIARQAAERVGQHWPSVAEALPA